MNKIFNFSQASELEQKLPYEAPEITVLSVELEHSIAAGSALVMPENHLNNQVLEEWYVDPDEERTINW